jgi:hypothetical protein
LVDWFRRTFSGISPDDEAAEREEYGVPDRGDDALRREFEGPFATSEGAEAAEDELGEFKAPPDPNP